MTSTPPSEPDDDPESLLDRLVKLSKLVLNLARILTKLPLVVVDVKPDAGPGVWALQLMLLVLYLSRNRKGE